MAKEFRVTIGNLFVSRQDFMGLCHDRAILWRDIVGHAGTFFVATEDF